jgi:hypothetical protein
VDVVLAEGEERKVEEWVLLLGGIGCSEAMDRSVSAATMPLVEILKMSVTKRGEDFGLHGGCRGQQKTDS